MECLLDTVLFRGRDGSSYSIRTKDAYGYEMKHLKMDELSDTSALILQISIIQKPKT